MSSLFTPFSALPLRQTRATVSCCSSGHVSFIKEVAVTEPPTHLQHLLKVLQTRGETIISPGTKQGLIPLAIPLSKDSSGSVTALLRWPTAPPGYDILVRSFLVTLNYMLFEFNLLLSKNRLDMPVVEVWRSGVRLIARNVDEYIHRILVEEDAQEMSELYIASAEAGEKLYKKGAFAESQIDNLDVYVLKKVGLFPDVLEKKVLRHFDEGDHVSAMVTGEFYTRKDLFPGFGRPFVYYANILQKVGRDSEAKEAARVALKSPWWTLGCPYEEVASIAQWEDEQIEFIREKVSDEGRFEDLKKGKDPIQVALDVAAFLLDLASIEGTWSESLHHIAKCYEEAGLKDMSNFILYTDDK
ncbi:protein IN CHLOROPLAST ATPASE BIOGENESIS, chloroplastic isoform X2 [Brassica rapa]|uniref:protein IN CHLOROPLAST ATPASE BIOGENESIS, chloroplastic isoform X2 n=1 Tax=Brassica campestris TaxID=3711 RepID=UPI00142E4258|nr:protein IN CHLOROPLAST ATPASE BIOGENESIS, chloroplastic isoform X2 [Brassica rapa]